ncbi:MAG TPA: hypothetical protein VD905_11890, partial [Flavobacteriales bacterium]|nr:hypothetical protein [Flavobacteriales bacterium]
MKKAALIPVLFCIALLGMSFISPVQTGEWKEITIKEYDALIDKASAFFETKKTFSVDVEIASYKTHTDKVAYEKQKGYTIRSGNYYHQFMLGVHSYQNKQYRFVVDSVEKNIMIANPEGAHYSKMLMSSFENFHSYITKTQKIDMKDFY